MKGKCEVCDLQAELDATNRQVEILSDALAESRRQRQWVDLTPQELTKVFANSITGEGAVHLALAKFKELNT
jgi:hypothetical protein